MTTADLEVLPPELLAHLSDAELAEYLTLLDVCQRIDGTWRLQPKQQQAEDACAELMERGEVFELLYGGAGAGGKSEWLLWHLHECALKYAGFSGLLIRRTYTELNRTAILRSLARFDKGQAKYHATNKVWLFDNGSRIEFGYCESDRDVYQYDSAEYDCIAWDELTQFPTSVPYNYLFSRLRSSMTLTVQGYTPHVIAGTNPHRTGVAWVKPRWVDPAPPLTVFPEESELEDGSTRRVWRTFIPAKMTDNRFVNQRAYRDALSMLPDATRRAIEEGSWDVIEGQYFGEWDSTIHVVPPFQVPDWWFRATGYDFGIANPACHLWGAFDGDGVCFVYREMYGAELTIGAQAHRIKQPEVGEKIGYRVADPSIWTRTGAGPPIAAQFSDLGVHFRKANNARIDGWARVREYLALTVPTEVNPETHETRYMPRLYVFSTCRNLIRTLPLLVHDETKIEDVDTDGEDHAGDALRYLLMSRPLRSRSRARVPKSADQQTWERLRTSLRDEDQLEHPHLGRILR